MAILIKLNLKQAIIMEDSRRIDAGIDVINNLNRLALELEHKHDGKYDYELLYKVLYKSIRFGYKATWFKTVHKDLLKDLTDALNCSENDIVIRLAN